MSVYIKNRIVHFFALSFVHQQNNCFLVLGTNLLFILRRQNKILIIIIIIMINQLNTFINSQMEKYSKKMKFLSKRSLSAWYSRINYECSIFSHSWVCLIDAYLYYLYWDYLNLHRLETAKDILKRMKR